MSVNRFPLGCLLIIKAHELLLLRELRYERERRSRKYTANGIHTAEGHLELGMENTHTHRGRRESSHYKHLLILQRDPVLGPRIHEMVPKHP